MKKEEKLYTFEELRAKFRKAGKDPSKWKSNRNLVRYLEKKGYIRVRKLYQNSFSQFWRKREKGARR